MELIPHGPIQEALALTDKVLTQLSDSKVGSGGWKDTLLFVGGIGVGCLLYHVVFLPIVLEKRKQKEIETDTQVKKENISHQATPSNSSVKEHKSNIDMILAEGT